MSMTAYYRGCEQLAHDHLDQEHGTNGRYRPPPEREDHTPVEELATLHKNGECPHFESLTELYGDPPPPLAPPPRIARRAIYTRRGGRRYASRRGGFTLSPRNVPIVEDLPDEDLPDQD